jgi:hypothetical protein
LLPVRVIDSLPAEWPDEPEQPVTSSPANATSRGARRSGASTANSNRKSNASRASGLETFAEGARYKQLHARLLALQERRAQARKRVSQAKKLRDMLRPFEDPANNIQGNLVTRDGELGRELEKMVVLSARVGGKLGEAKNA